MPFVHYPHIYAQCETCGTPAKRRCVDQRYADDPDRRDLKHPHPKRPLLVPDRNRRQRA